MHIAIADRDAAAADLLAFVAGRRGHRAAIVDRAEGLLSGLPFAPAVIVLAIDEFDARELGIIRSLREDEPGPVVIVTTARKGGTGPGEAMKAGAHDVIREPYDPNEVVLRAERWVQNRAQGAPSTTTVSFADLSVDLDRYRATKNGRELTLTKLELRLLYCLCEHQPHIASLERLLSFGWDDSEEPDPSLLKTHMSHLRSKLRQAGGAGLEIRSRQMIGYAIAAATPAHAGAPA